MADDKNGRQHWLKKMTQMAEWQMTPIADDTNAKMTKMADNTNGRQYWLKKMTQLAEWQMTPIADDTNGKMTDSTNSRRHKQQNSRWQK